MKLASCAQTYRQTAIRTASPGQLILMLFDGALRFLHGALTGFEEENVIRRNEAIHTNLVKTQAVFSELQASLDLSRGGDFAQRMFQLYDYMQDQIRYANLRKEQAPIRIVVDLLSGIRQSWMEMLAQWEATVHGSGLAVETSGVSAGA